MLNVLLRAPLLTNSGYGVHSRQIFKWLNSIKDINLIVECLSWGRTSWIINPSFENNLIEKIMEKSKIFKGKYDITFQVQLPDEWDVSLGKKNIGISAVVETDRCNPAWVENCNKMDEIIVPSTFSKNVLMNSGIINTKITIIPEWYNEQINNRKLMNNIVKSNSNYKFASKFNFLMISQLTSLHPNLDRKNLVNSIKWFLEEFKDDKNVGLVLKTNSGKSTKVDYQMTLNNLKNIVSTFRKDSNYPKIHLIHGRMTSEEIGAIYNVKNIKCYMTATRGEGYGLPLVDAAASGMPIVSTGWSGHYEFLDRQLVNNVDYNLVNIPDEKVDNRIFLKGFMWAEPSEIDFKKKIRSVYENYQKNVIKAKKLQKHVAENFCSEKITKLYNNLFNEVRNC